MKTVKPEDVEVTNIEIPEEIEGSGGLVFFLVHYTVCGKEMTSEQLGTRGIMDDPEYIADFIDFFKKNRANLENTRATIS